MVPKESFLLTCCYFFSIGYRSPLESLSNKVIIKSIAIHKYSNNYTIPEIFKIMVWSHYYLKNTLLL